MVAGIALVVISEDYADRPNIPLLPSHLVMGSLVTIIVGLCVLAVSGVRLLRMRGRDRDSPSDEPQAVAVPTGPSEPATTGPSFRTRIDDLFEGAGEILGYLASAVAVVLALNRMWVAAGIVFGVTVILPFAFFGVERTIGGTLRMWHHFRWHPRSGSARTTMLMTPEPDDWGRVLLEPVDAVSTQEGPVPMGSVYVDLEMRTTEWQELVKSPARVPVIVLGDSHAGGVAFVQVDGKVLRPRARAIGTLPADENPAIRTDEARETARQRELAAADARRAAAEQAVAERVTAKPRSHRVAWLVGALSCGFFLVFAVYGLLGNIALHQRGVNGIARVDRLACDHYQSMREVDLELQPHDFVPGRGHDLPAEHLHGGRSSVTPVRGRDAQEHSYRVRRGEPLPRLP